MDYKNAVLTMEDCSWTRNSYDELTLSGMVEGEYPLNVMMPDEEQKKAPVLREDQEYKVHIEITEYGIDIYDSVEDYEGSPKMVIPVGTMEGDCKGAFIFMHGIVKAIDAWDEENCVVSISTLGGIYHLLMGNEKIDNIKVGNVITGKFYVEGKLVV